MDVTDKGAAVQDVIMAVKLAIKEANVSATDKDRDLRVRSVTLILHALATRSAGTGLKFTVPFIGMEVSVGAKVTTSDTHEIEINLAAPGPAARYREEVREAPLDEVLTDAIDTIRAAVAAAAKGDDQFSLSGATVRISFAVTKEGDISIGVNGSLSQEVTHTLVLGLAPA